MSIRSADAFDRAACLGLGDLFASIDWNDHRAARALCAECPALAACRGEVQTILDTSGVRAFGRARPEGTLSGTWAGTLYGCRGRRPAWLLAEAAS